MSLKVLYAEDDDDLRELFATALEDAGVELLVASNGLEALDLYHKHHPFFLITDLLMPRMDGFELIREIRKTDPDIFVVVTTAHNESNKIIDAIDAGVDKFLLKPIDFDKMMEIIAKYIPQARDRARHGEKLKQDESFLGLIWNNLDIGLVATDAEHKIVRANDVAKKLLGYKHNEILRVDFSKHCVALEKRFESVAKIGLRYALFSDYEFHSIETVDEKKIPIICKKTLFSDKDNNQFFLHMMLDITQQIQDIKQSQYDQSLLIQQSKLASIGEMLGFISHQWRQPLNTLSILITNFVTDCEEVQCSLQKNSEIFEENAFKQISFMSKTIEDFKNFYRPDIGAEYFSITQSVHEVINLMLPLLQKESIEIDVQDRGFEKLTIRSLNNQIKQVLMILFSNARDAMYEKIKKDETRKGKITISFEEFDDKIAIKIKDNGGGISAPSIDDIFLPFYTTKGTLKGTGIGLSMCKTIIEKNLGGKISVHNTKDGACFTILLYKEFKDAT